MRPIDADAVIKNLGDIVASKNRFGRGIEAGISNAILRLENASTLTLDDLRPKGRWVKKPWKMLGCVLRYDTVCSECGFDAPEFTEGGCNTVLTKFCHNCGAKMENGEW